ncbi:hypothetical protein B4N89_25455 [Embleya scabrispora]|uniref:Lipoprotein n=1 Tax=Embleya scabrispora TaxID=159449 RepID=A0A1T3P8B0_9ACTN|nr:hypothetical protein [Embleya scabrispora]OPC85294.1 hypothetical protein B4N89_25455 [Embleya scabrispora]
MSVLSTRGLAAVAIAGALGLGLSACGDDSKSNTSTGATQPAATQPAQSAPTAPGTPGGVANGGVGKAVLKAGTDAKLGPIVTDGNGFTLYRFDKDTAKPSASNCDGACATQWPPVTTTDGVTVTGVDRSAVGSVTRGDGSTQVTIAGWPVYRFAPDTRPGDTKGQGVKGTWFAVTPDGKKAGAAATGAPQTSNAPTTSGGGYSY